MKAHTDLEQSKKLAEILPLESADMSLQQIYDENHMMSDYRVGLIPYRLFSGIGVPCWSLSALLEVLPDELEEGYYLTLNKEVKNTAVAMRTIMETVLNIHLQAILLMRVAK